MFRDPLVELEKLRMTLLSVTDVDVSAVIPDLANAITRARRGWPVRIPAAGRRRRRAEGPYSEQRKGKRKWLV